MYSFGGGEHLTKLSYHRYWLLLRNVERATINLTHFGKVQNRVRNVSMAVKSPIRWKSMKPIQNTQYNLPLHTQSSKYPIQMNWFDWMSHFNLDYLSFRVKKNNNNNKILGNKTHTSTMIIFIIFGYASNKICFFCCLRSHSNIFVIGNRIECEIMRILVLW